jgi:hypothetical protein
LLCQSNSEDTRLLVDLKTKSGIQQVCSLFDTGASITLIQPYLEPDTDKLVGYIDLKGYQANSPTIQAPVYNVEISLDGVTWKTIQAAITSNMAEPMILSPQNVPNTSFLVTSTDQD